MALQRLKDAAEKRKDLSGVSSTNQLAIYHSRRIWTIAFGNDIDTCKFDELTADLVERTKYQYVKR